MCVSPTSFRILLIANGLLAVLVINFANVFPELMPASIRTVVEQASDKHWARLPETVSLIVHVLTVTTLALMAFSFLALFLFQRWGRPLALAALLVWVALTPLMGPHAFSAWELFVTELHIGSWAFVILLTWSSSLKPSFDRDRASSGFAVSAPDMPPGGEAASSPFSQSRGLSRNLLAGLRGMLMLRLEPGQIRAHWSQMVLLLVFSLAVQLAEEVLLVGESGQLAIHNLPAALFGWSVLLFAAWTLALLAGKPQQTLLVLVGFQGIDLMIDIIYRLLAAQVSPLLGHGGDWYTYLFVSGWFLLALALAATRLLQLAGFRKFAVFLLIPVLVGAPLTQIPRDPRLWVAVATESDWSTSQNHRQQRALLQERNFYLQPELLERELTAVRPGRKDGIDLYFVGFAGYSSQNVFMKEVRYIGDLFRQRYGTAGRSVTLVNNPDSIAESPLASVTSLQRTLRRIGERMNRDQDILFLYLTSHGSEHHEFSIKFGEMRFEQLTPQRLREVLDQSGIKRRVIVVSACYSGGFVDALKTDDSLIITAAAADRTSFGCSNLSEITWFGKAYFQDALQQTDSFIEAFDIAKQIVTEQEGEQGYPHSEPQIFIGPNIGKPLEQFRRQNAGMQSTGSRNARPTGANR